MCRKHHAATRPCHASVAVRCLSAMRCPGTCCVFAVRVAVRRGCQPTCRPCRGPAARRARQRASPCGRQAAARPGAGRPGPSASARGGAPAGSSRRPWTAHGPARGLCRRTSTAGIPRRRGAAGAEARRAGRRARRIVATPMDSAWRGTCSSPKKSPAASTRVGASSSTRRVRLAREDLRARPPHERAAPRAPGRRPRAGARAPARNLRAAASRWLRAVPSERGGTPSTGSVPNPAQRLRGGGRTRAR